MKREKEKAFIQVSLIFFKSEFSILLKLKFDIFKVVLFCLKKI